MPVLRELGCGGGGDVAAELGMPDAFTHHTLLSGVPIRLISGLVGWTVIRFACLASLLGSGAGGGAFLIQLLS